MKCPRCQIELEEGHCPKCEWAPSAPSQKKTPTDDRSQQSLGFPMEFKTSQLKPTTQDWRTELREKLKKHYSEKSDSPRSDKRAQPLSRTIELPVPDDKPKPASKPQRRERTDSSESPRTKATAPPPSPVFSYKMADPPSEAPKVVTFKKTTTPAAGGGSVKEKPLIRPPLKTRVVTRKPSLQQRPLTLETLRTTSPTRGEEEPSTQAIRAESLSPEILLSRFLSFIIDLLVAIGAGIFFSFAASSLLGIPFPYQDTLWMAGLCTAGSFFLNSVFLLYTIGQTPGMILTNLELVPDDTERLLLSAVLVRVLTFVPIAATVIGLLWGLFDPLRRCWHDHLSATRVVSHDRPQLSA